MIPPLLLPSSVSPCPRRSTQSCAISREKPEPQFAVDFRPLLRGGFVGHRVELLGGCSGSRRRLAVPDGWRARGADDGGAEAVAGRDASIAGDCVDRDVAAAAGVLDGRLGPVDGRAEGRGAQQQHGNDGKREGLHGFGVLFVCLLGCVGLVCRREREKVGGLCSTFIIPWLATVREAKKRNVS